MGSGASRRRKDLAQQKPVFPRLSLPHASLKVQYDVVVVGSGYGASIAASRCARAGQSVCVLERGKEWLPGDFPETFREASKQMQVTFGGKEKKIDMIKPTPYPDNYPPLHKMERMKEGLSEFDIEDLDKMFYKTPLYVNFQDTPSNHVGVPQPKCTACGNCCGGCNVGAKNTLNMNYLPDAKAHGVEMFTEVEVTAVLKSHNSTDWIVSYKRIVPGSFELEEQTVSATYVILGAGAIGSTKILLRSKERGLDVSDEIGKRFSTNGDVLGFSYNGDNKANSVGVETKNMTSAEPPGPCITSVMDFRKVNGGSFENNFVIEDGTPPSILSIPFAVGVSFSAKVIGIDKYPANELLEKTFQELQGKGIDNTLSFLCMSHDSASGVISFENKTDNIDITWDRVGFEKSFENVNQALEKIARGLGGTFVKNPTWLESLGRSVVSAHPLGGCPMGESGRTAVVNHAGQVFDGETDEILDGLYVVDGAILPRAVGVNPSLTIACLAERCMRLLAEREGWRIDYDTFIPLERTAFAKRKPGIRFTESMVGTFSSTKNKNEETPCEFTVTVESDDVERMIQCDPAHAARMSGTVTCSALSTAPMTITGGHFQFLNQSTEHIDTKELVYKMILTGIRGKTFSFHGIKYVKNNHFGETGLDDTTILFVTVYQGKNFSGKPVGKGKLFVTLPNFMKQLAVIEITHTDSKAEKLKWKSRFVAFFTGSLLDVYSPVTTKKSRFDLNAPPRIKRPLRLNGKHPEVHKCITQDKFELRLTRFEGGRKGPVVMFHGIGVSSGIFSLDTIETNLVEFLVEHRYDVWLVDWRVSCDLPWAVYQDYTLDDCAKLDYPAAIDKVLEITKQKTVQVFAHCGGSLVFFASLLSGALEGKIRNLVCSQVAANPVPAQFNKLKAGLFLPGTAEALGVDGLTVDTDDFASLSESLFNSFAKGVTRIFLPYDELCRNPVCHRITFTYGLLWEHENLNPLTHDSLHEFFGYVSTKVVNQLSLTMKKRKLVSASGKDIYLPDVDKKDRLNSEAYKKHIRRLNIPICFIAGERNSCYLPESTFRTFNLAKEAHPTQEYTWIQIPDYGHLDCIYGKAAVHDVYPYILKALDAHAQDELLLDAFARNSVKNAVASLKSKVCHTDGSKKMTATQPAPTTDLEVKHQDNDSSDDEEELVYPAEASDVFNPSEVKSIWDKLSEITPLEAWQEWPSKANRKNTVKKEPSYRPPTGTDTEKVEVREMLNPTDPVKNMILSMSDLHLDCDWSKNMHDRLYTFITKLASVAEVSLHTLILLGDVVEMWLEPMTLSPLTLQERITKWKSNITCKLFFNVVRKMAEEDGVKVFYIRGNHDHEMTSEAVEELMGRKVEFIEGTLIYIINSDYGHQYRIRFAHGHDWDLFNTYSLTDANDPLGGRPIGYYVTRAVATTETVMTETEEVLRQVTTSLMRMVGGELGSFVVEMLAKAPLQRKFTESMIERGLDRDVNDDEYILLEEGKWIKVSNLLKYRYIKRAIDKFGSSYTYSLLKGSIGNFDDFLSQCGEDVVVLGHTHQWRDHRIRNRIGKTIYINTGCWIDYAHEFSYAKIIPPTKTNPGCVQVRRDVLETDGIV
ncbi:uncharacterized protein LOC144664495 isoform X2 [Oculina patagonica]